MAIQSVMRRRRRVEVSASTRPAVTLDDQVITKLVETADFQPEESRIKAGYIHVSSLLDFCARRIALVGKDSVELSNFPRSGDRLVWAIGRTVERHVRDSVIQSLNAAGVFGKWTCLCGDIVTEGYRTNQNCSKCGSAVGNYVEHVVYNHELMICGSTDLLVDIEDKMLVNEIKSINKKAFEELEAPMANHIFQAVAYHKMLSDTGKRLHDNVVIFYACKEYMWKTPYKEFHIHASSHYPIVEQMFSKVEELRNCERKQILPPKLPVCAIPTSPTSKNCAMCVSCHSR